MSCFCYIRHCLSLFVLLSFFFMPLNWLVLWFTDSNYPFCTFKISLLVIILTVYLQCVASEYSFGIFKSFFSGITFIPYSQIQTMSHHENQDSKLNVQYRLVDVTYDWGRTTPLYCNNEPQRLMKTYCVWQKLICTYVVYSDDMNYYVHIHVVNFRHICT